MNKEDNMSTTAAYMVWRHNILVAGGIIEITDCGPGSWNITIRSIRNTQLAKFHDNIDRVKNDGIIINLKDVPDIDLILPQNTALTVQQAYETIRDIDKHCRPAAFPVKPNPVKS